MTLTEIYKLKFDQLKKEVVEQICTKIIANGFYKIKLKRGIVVYDHNVIGVQDWDVLHEVDAEKCEALISSEKYYTESLNNLGINVLLKILEEIESSAYVGF